VLARDAEELQAVGVVERAEHDAERVGRVALAAGRLDVDREAVAVVRGAGDRGGSACDAAPGLTLPATVVAERAGGAGAVALTEDALLRLVRAPRAGQEDGLAVGGDGAVPRPGGVVAERESGGGGEGGALRSVDLCHALGPSVGMRKAPCGKCAGGLACWG